MLVQQNSIPLWRVQFCSGEISALLDSVTLSSHMTDMSRKGGPYIEDHPKITGGIDPLNWLVGVSGCSYRP
jgi:hypothetical protein